MIAKPSAHWRSARVARRSISFLPASLLIAIFYLTADVGPVSSQEADNGWEREYIYAAHRIRVGESAQKISDELSKPWVGLETNLLARQYPFAAWVPYTNSSNITEWHSRQSTTDGWPLVVFAVFSDSHKTNLIDALLYSGGEGLKPLVDGPYNRNLSNIRRGDSMERVFRLLGVRYCQYFMGSDGKYHVTATYQNKTGNFVTIEADAGSGTVLKVTASRL